MQPGGTQNFVVRRLVSVPVTGRDEFMRQLIQSSDLPEGGMLIPGYVEQAVGSTLNLEIAFLAERVAMQVQCVVRRRVTQGKEQGSTVEFLPRASSSRDFMLRFASGREKAAPQVHRRYPIEIRCEWTRAGGRRPTGGTTVNLSLGGAQLQLARSARPGDRGMLRLQPSALNVLDIPVHVVWCSGNRCGVRFMFAQASDESLLAGLLELGRDHVVVAY